MRRVATVAFMCLVASLASAKVYFHESFDNGNSNWVDSTSKSDYGKFTVTAGDFSGDEEINKGLKTSQDARFYASSVAMPETVSNEGKDLVVSLSVKHEQGLDCGGGYIKVMPEMDQKSFNGDSEYFLMFGPDKCGYNNKVHIIFNYKGKNLLWKKEPRYPDDKLTHVYTLVVKPDNTYALYIDQEQKESGSLEADWAFLEPKEIDDPEDKKPADWVDDAQMDDPEDKKPEDWDSEPEKIVDPDAKQPEDWDEEEDGKWEAPMVPNPKYKGAWSPKRIPNPAYKGAWKPKQIPNPKYEADDKLYMIRKPLSVIGIDVWQVKSGSIFDNIVIGDNLDEVNAIVDKTWKATKDAEKAALDAKEKADKPASDDSAKADADADEEDKEDL
uniref:Calreticulin n=1 Tax=Neobodo designis TaxID=312471 RepID=A0A7S1LCP4_NEODS|mmetsp:Transcript_19412/g.60308  ORF Transcript_19412/g.60308 Transcript_19412/m.60308 type:complete len:386 (+) Transcript_19412:51-1208(+)